MKNFRLLILLFILTGCASGRLDIIDANGKIVGECTAGYEWHPYGVEDSVAWLLNYCAQQALNADCDNCSISDESILTKDFTIPEPPNGNSWNKKLAWKEFKSDSITEQKYGFILAYVENEYYLKIESAEQQLSKSIISQAEYEQLVEKAKLEFYGE